MVADVGRPVRQLMQLMQLRQLRHLRIDGRDSHPLGSPPDVESCFVGC